MNTINYAEILRLIRNLIRTGVVIDVDPICGVRVKTGELVTNWLPILTLRAGVDRSQWLPSVGEQVMLFSVGGDLTTAFVGGAIFCDEYPEPSSSLTANHTTYSDGATIEYEPKTGHLKATGVKTAEINAQEKIDATAPMIACHAGVKIELNTPEVACSDLLSCKSLSVSEGGEMAGNITHSGGSFSSNGVVIDKHKHSGVQRGDSKTDEPK